VEGYTNRLYLVLVRPFQVRTLPPGTTAGKFIRLNNWSTTLPEKGAFTRTELHLAAFVGG
jgi:hypothetical protein